MKVYHVSRNSKIKRFYVRVPKHRVYGENSWFNRICTSINVRNCIASFPYRSDLVVSTKVANESSYLCVYEFDVDKKDVMFPEDVYKAGVRDALDNKEHWILKNTSPSRKKIIKITKFNLSRYNKYTWEYYGDITELEYEKSIESYDRVMVDTIYEERRYNKFIKEARKINAEILDVKCEDVYFAYGWKSDDDYYPEYKHYSNNPKKIYTVKYKIPKNENAHKMWEIVMECYLKYRKRTFNRVSVDYFNKYIKE